MAVITTAAKLNEKFLSGLQQEAYKPRIAPF